MPATGYTPRLSVDITEAQQEALKRYIPHGTLKPLMHAIIDDIIQLVQKLGPNERTYFYGTLIRNKMSVDEVLPTLKDLTHGNDR